LKDQWEALFMMLFRLATKAIFGNFSELYTASILNRMYI